MTAILNNESAVPLKVLAVVPNIYDKVPGQRFRIEQWEPWLAKLGVEISYAPFESEELNQVVHQKGKYFEKAGGLLSGVLRRLQLAKRVQDFDVIYIFRESSLIGPAWFERLVKLRGRPMAYDFDDAVWVANPSSFNGWFSFLKMAGKTRTSCRLATHVMAGNPYLAEYAKKVNAQTTVVPTTIDLEKYTLQPRREADVPVIGWSGSFSTVAYLDTIKSALQQLAQTERFQLRVIGTSNYQVPGIDVLSLPWRAESEVEDLRPIDIGVMPLVDDDFSRGKCGLKALQYMALGIPPVVSPVGVNTEIVRDGVNGFLAPSDDDWIAALRKLLRDPDLRQKMGEAARKTVEIRYSAELQSQRVFEIFKVCARSAH